MTTYREINDAIEGERIVCQYNKNNGENLIAGGAENIIWCLWICGGIPDAGIHCRGFRFIPRSMDAYRGCRFLDGCGIA